MGLSERIACVPSTGQDWFRVRLDCDRFAGQSGCGDLKN